ncbi:FMRFamide receptor-like [Tubulanus polymorphus]|uniref:FMRFamide receptor-like n=1 Tax=Tubulanus polymorphus TaxID=672921 RepID=UPI003DA66508
MSLRGSSIVYLQVLAIADATNCLTGVFGRDLRILSSYNPFEFIRYDYIYRAYAYYVHLYVDVIFQMTTNTSPWILFALSIDRYIAIRFPLSARRICRIGIAFRISAIAWILTFAFEIPTIWDKETYTVHHDQPCTYTGQRKLLLLNRRYAFYYDFIFGQIVLKTIPGLIVSACNVHMVFLVRAAALTRRTLQKSEKESNSMHSKQSRQITMTILALNVIFMAEYVLDLVNTFLPAVLPTNLARKYRPYHLGYLLHSVNAMINLFVYMCIRRGFGHTLVWICSCHRFGARE